MKWAVMAVERSCQGFAQGIKAIKDDKPLSIYMSIYMYIIQSRNDEKNDRPGDDGV